MHYLDASIFQRKGAENNKEKPAVGQDDTEWKKEVGSWS